MKTKILDLLKTVNRPGMDSLIKWLEDSDYFRAPASAEYHLNYEGGLALHSYKVYSVLEGIAKKYAPETPHDSIIICGLLHDLAKVNFYVRELRNKKINNKWESVEVWGYNDQIPLGHGPKSALLISDHIKLTRDEQYSIVHHMFAFGAEGYEQRKAMNGAIEKSKLLKCLILADMISTFFLEDKNLHI